MQKDFANPVKYCCGREKRRSAATPLEGFPARMGRGSERSAPPNFSSGGGAPWRVIGVQLVFIVGLIVFFTLYLPHRARVLAQRAVINREQKINDFFHKSVVVDSTLQISVPIDGEVVTRHPQKLIGSLSPQGVESQLGAPTISTTDFRGGEHLTWMGTTHKLVASFTNGSLYCLTLEDRTTGHGVMVYQSPDSWHPY